MLFLVGWLLHSEKDNLRLIPFIIKRFSFKILIETILIIGIMLFCYFNLSHVFPFLNWGWLNMVNGGNGGNVLITPVLETTMILGNIGIIILVIFLFALFLLFPSAALLEEKEYREKDHEWKRIIPKSIKFGLSHLIMGIPITLAISLIIPGLFFAYKYKTAYKKLINQ